MGKELAAFSLWQAEMHMEGKAPKEQIDKMVKIVNRDPEGTWDSRGFDLLEAAIKELEVEESSK